VVFAVGLVTFNISGNGPLGSDVIDSSSSQSSSSSQHPSTKYTHKKNPASPPSVQDKPHESLPKGALSTQMDPHHNHSQMDPHHNHSQMDPHHNHSGGVSNSMYTHTTSTRPRNTESGKLSLKKFRTQPAVAQGRFLETDIDAHINNGLPLRVYDESSPTHTPERSPVRNGQTLGHSIQVSNRIPTANDQLDTATNGRSRETSGVLRSPHTDDGEDDYLVPLQLNSYVTVDHCLTGIVKWMGSNPMEPCACLVAVELVSFGTFCMVFTVVYHQLVS